jgi:hypothetical protein
MSEWISVDEKKPDIFYPNKILVVVKNVNCSFVAIAGYFDDYKDDDFGPPYEQKAHFELEDIYAIDLPAAVTHWMPLPEPPEAAKGEKG